MDEETQTNTFEEHAYGAELANQDEVSAMRLSQATTPYFDITIVAIVLLGLAVWLVK